MARPTPDPIHHPLVVRFLADHDAWSPAHRQNARSILNRYTRWLGGHGIDVAEATTSDIRAYLAGRGAVSGATRHKEYQFIGWFYTWQRGDELVYDDDRRRRSPVTDVKAPRVDEPALERTAYVSELDYARLMRSFRRDRPLDLRNAAICSLMYWSGLRRSEVARLRLGDLHLDASPAMLVVLGAKTNRQRTIPLTEDTTARLRRYLDHRLDEPAHVAALFVGSLGAEDPRGHMRPDAISSMLERRCAKLGMRITAHQFRRSSTINAMARGLKDSTVQYLHGWDGRAGAEMMARYGRDGRAAAAAADFAANDPTARRARAATRMPQSRR